MNKLEAFLAGTPLNERLKQLRDGGDDELPDIETAIAPRTYADGTPVSDADRKHLKRMMVSAGWQVLLKLLDTELQHREDAARRNSLESPLTRKDEIAAAWAELVADRKARVNLVALAESEVAKLKASV